MANTSKLSFAFTFIVLGNKKLDCKFVWMQIVTSLHIKYAVRHLQTWQPCDVLRLYLANLMWAESVLTKLFTKRKQMNNNNANEMHGYKFIQFDNRPNEICLDTLSTHM